MIESEEGIKHGKASAIISAVIFVALSFAVICLACFAYLKKQGVDIGSVSFKDLLDGRLYTRSQENGGKNAFSIGYELKEHPVFILHRNYIVKCTKDTIKGLDKKGQEKWNIPVSIENPIVKVSSGYFLVADEGGKEIDLVYDTSLKWSKKLENSIINADISDSGYVTIIHESKGYKGTVSVFNPQGDLLFTRYIGENFPVLAKISPSGNTVVIDSIDATGAFASASLEFVNRYGKPFAKVTKEDMILSSLWYLEDDSIAAAGNSSLFLFDREGQQKWQHDFKGGKVYSLCVAMGKYVVVASGGGVSVGAQESAGGKAVVEIINSSGKLVSSYLADREVVNLEAYGDRIAVNCGRKVYFINLRGKLINQFSPPADILRVYFFNKQQAAVITKNSVTVFEIG